MIDVTPKKNILHYSDRPYGGGEGVTSIWCSNGTTGLDFCIDSGINWTEVYNTYNGIEMDVYATSSGVWSGNNFIAGTLGLTYDPGVRAYEVKNAGTFVFQTDALGGGGEVISRFSTNYNRDSLGFGSYSGGPLTASLQLYKATGSGNFYKKLYLRGRYGNLIDSLELGPGIVPTPPGIITGSEYNLCLFTDPYCFKHQISEASVTNHLGYCAWQIYGYDGTVKTPLFLGRAWKDQENRGCIKDELSGKLFYSLGTAIPAPVN